MRRKEKKRARNSVRGDKLPYLMRNRCMCALWLLTNSYKPGKTDLTYQRESKRAQI